MRFFHLLIPFLVISCSMPRMDEFVFNSPKFNSTKEACKWVDQNIEYKKDAYDYWKLPQETISDGKGDCEDQALLLMGIMKYQKNYESELVIVDLSNNRSELHALVRWKNKYYDCTNGEEYSSINYEITDTYSYQSAMDTARYLKNY